ncbi:MAG: hypothetical protein ACRDBP_00800 [Luteolibacter sp.]
MNPEPKGGWSGIAMMVVLLSGLSGTKAMCDGADGQPFRLEHRGLLQMNKSTASLHGIGTTVMFQDEFELSVDGQFKLIGSASLTKTSGRGRPMQLRHSPTFVSIVAIGNVRLECPVTGKTYCGHTAVYRVNEGYWTLDGTRVGGAVTR